MFYLVSRHGDFDLILNFGTSLFECDCGSSIEPVQEHDRSFDRFLSMMHRSTSPSLAIQTVAREYVHVGWDIYADPMKNLGRPPGITQDRMGGYVGNLHVMFLCGRHGKVVSLSFREYIISDYL